MDKERFEHLCFSQKEFPKKTGQIGTLKEKKVHAVLKYYFSPDPKYHEIKIGRYVADIALDEGIYEIQTRNFNKLRNKLEVFLALGKVTIVYPVEYVKYIRYLVPETGEVSPPRKSPKRGTPYFLLEELYQISPYMNHPNLKICIMIMQVEEYRYLDGLGKSKKKRATKIEKFPITLFDEIHINKWEDYSFFLQDCLSEPFTSQDYKKATGLPLNKAQKALWVLHYIGIVKRIGKQKNSYLYIRSRSMQI